MIICEGCGIRFKPKEANRKRFCSRDCAFKHRCGKADTKQETQKIREIKRLTKLIARIKPCAQCGNKTLTRFCSRDCSKEYYKKQMLEIVYTKKTILKQCINCNLLFKIIYVTGHHNRTRCPQCTRQYARRNHIHGKAESRARKAGVSYQTIDKKKVFERDYWRCHICKRKTPFKYMGTYNKRAPELDHITPLNAHGTIKGNHIYENVKCACRECNSKKGNKPLGQPLLFGMIPTRSVIKQRPWGDIETNLVNLL
jgi:hypothetical protein